MIVFRVSIDNKSGLGHLTRCAVLAREIQDQGEEVIFVGDFIDEKSASFLLGIDHVNLYNSPPEKLNEEQDAQSFLALISSYSNHPLWVVVDHYHLSAAWEEIVSLKNIAVMAIDDLVRKHHCQAVLDYRWNGKGESELYTRPVGCVDQRLMGPDYLLVAKEFSHTNYQQDKTNSTLFKLLIGLGGGGNAAVLDGLLNNILAESETSEMYLHIKVIVGPFLEGKEALIERFSIKTFQYAQLEFVVGKTDLYSEFQWCDFYLGAAGGSLYQLRLLKKPALTFSLLSNQVTNQTLLDDIGHYFHLNEFSSEDFPKMACLVMELIKNITRIHYLFSESKIELDYDGAQRVTAFLLNGKLSTKKYKNTLTQEGQEISDGFRLRPVQDSDINHYLMSRNLPANCNNMIDAKPIKVLDHYQWWFKTSRRSFLLLKQQQPLLYIWDEINTLDGQEYLIGGWFVCNDDTSFQDAMVALDWQLKKCATDYPNAVWIAVISKQNKYVKLLNDYFGFKEVEASSRYTKVVNQLFPNANEQEFFYVYK